MTVIALGGVFVDAYDFTSLGIGTIQLRHEFHLSVWFFVISAIGAALAPNLTVLVILRLLIIGWEAHRCRHRGRVDLLTG